MTHNPPQGYKIQFINVPIKDDRVGSASVQRSPSHSQHSPMSTHSQQDASKVHQDGGDQTTQLLSRSRLQKLVKEVDPTMQLGKEVEDMLLKTADNFIDTTLYEACLLAKSKNAPRVEVKDVQIQLERLWNMKIPGSGKDEKKPRKLAAVPVCRKRKMFLINCGEVKEWTPPLFSDD